MRLRHLLLSACSAAALCASTAAHAARPAPQATPLAGQRIESLDKSGPHLQSTCNLGVSTGAAFIVNYVAPPDDGYFTLLDPAACSCPGNAVQLNAAHVALAFPVACTQQVRVRVVAAVLTAPGCYEPDPAVTLCGPVFYDLSPAAPGNYQFTMPMPLGCCIPGPAFLEINFNAAGAGCSTSSTVPRLITTASCVGCTSYNVYPGGFDDLCSITGFPGNPLMWADGDCCAATPTRTGSWGRVKTLYR